MIRGFLSWGLATIAWAAFFRRVEHHLFELHRHDRDGGHVRGVVADDLDAPEIVFLLQVVVVGGQLQRLFHEGGQGRWGAWCWRCRG